MNNQDKKAMLPNNKIKNCSTIPIIIKTSLNIVPIILEKTFEIKVLKNSPISKPLGYLHLYLLQGENMVLIKIGTEKKLAPNEI